METFTFTPSKRHEQMNRNGLKIGRHYSPGGKYVLSALGQCLDEAASAMQIMGGNPRHYWCSGSIADQDVARFKDLSSHLYKVLHTCYVINLGEDPDVRAHRMSIAATINALQWAEKTGCDSVVFHPGSPKDHAFDDSMGWCEAALREVLATYEGPVELLLENAANRKKIGGRIEHLTHLRDAIPDERLGICIDTTHAYASGYDHATICEQIRTVEKLRLVHFNQPDPEVECGKQLDRHSSCFIDGKLKITEMRDLFLAARQRDLPMILEGTPDLTADMVWMLRWEMANRGLGNDPRPTPKDLSGIDRFEADR